MFPQALPLPLTVADPIWTMQLAESLHMTVQDLGNRMSLYELCVLWPAYFRWKQRAETRERRKQEAAQKMRRGR